MSDSRDRSRKPKPGGSSGNRRSQSARGGSGKGGSEPTRGSRRGSAGSGRRTGGSGTGSSGGSSRGSSGGGSGSRYGSKGSGGRSGGTAGGKASGRSGGSSGSRSGGAGGGKSGTTWGAKPWESDQEPRKLPSGAEGLPRHVVESLMRVTPAKRQNAALVALAEATEAFAEGQYHVAVRKAGHAKDLASRDATIREILAISAYRVGDWHTALRELRTYRRLSGETTHMPVEMDVLRAMNRPKDVVAVWEEFKRLDGGPAVKKEARVVYASHLIDSGELDAAADVVGRPKKIAEPWPEDLRLWYVAARIAALQGHKQDARRIADSIVLEDPSFPGLDELDKLIDR